VKAREFILQETPGVFPTQGAVAYFVNTTGLLYPSSAIIDPSGTLHVYGLDVSGDTTLNNTTVLGTLDVSGATTLNNVSVNGTLDVSGATTLRSTLDVSGDATFNIVRINKTLDVSGTTSLNNTTVRGTLDVSGATSLNNTTVRGTLDVSGATSLNNTTVRGTLDVSGNTGIRGNLDVSGNIKVYGTLDVSGYDVYKELSYLNNNAAIVGSITMFGGAAAPTGWLLCQGGSYAAAAYPELFAVIGTTFGGGAGNFNVPDLTQRFPYGKGVAAIPALGTTGGSATITDVPAHSHALVDLSGGGNAKVISTDSGHSHTIGCYTGIGFDAGTGDIAFAGRTNPTSTASANITSTISGSTNSYGSASVSILPPYITLNYIICYTAKTAAH
jgi:microcystin-dependent protein/cytoskeletal protein CcmA (bactofilin family)